ncbi:MAG: metallophosphoesterase family protein [Euryarchaeota archaeon]|nr:metallophosphoesterase family protein [Euryarchaeota archaeon]
MRILVASDIHASPRAAQMIRDRIREHGPDVFVAAGDLTNFGPIEYARELLQGLPVPTLAVPGNCDPRSVVPVLTELGVNLHGRKVTLAGHTFVGIGGSNPTPFHTPFELSEREIEQALRRVMEPSAILVSHPPPRGAVDVVHSGEHVGSVAVRTIVEEYKPPVVLCGHIHEARGVAKIGPTTVVNSGLAREGHAAIVDVDGDITVQLL